MKVPAAFRHDTLLIFNVRQGKTQSPSGYEPHPTYVTSVDRDRSGTVRTASPPGAEGHAWAVTGARLSPFMILIVVGLTATG
ncbi:MAG: hypothetical protein OXC68_00855 [Aestuariivita sp.]|nr:hypothetical protein [Aestuariivita sp.]